MVHYKMQGKISDAIRLTQYSLQNDIKCHSFNNNIISRKEKENPFLRNSSSIKKSTSKEFKESI